MKNFMNKFKDKFQEFRDETIFSKIFKHVLFYTSQIGVMVIGLTTQYSMTVANH